MTTYQEIAKRSWTRILTDPVWGLPSPRSVHVPMNRPFSDHLLFCDCAFNAYRLPVYPDMNTQSEASQKLRDNARVNLLSFAFGEAPFVPDFRQTVWSRDPEAFPVIRGELNARQLCYTLEYALDPADDFLYVRVTVGNHKAAPQKAVVRLRTATPPESDMFDYHYVSFRWDASRWEKFGKAADAPEITSPGKWHVEQENARHFAPEEFNRDFSCPRPYYVHPGMQLGDIAETLAFSTELAAGETASFTFRYGFGGKTELPPAEFDTVVKRVRAEVDRLFAGSAEADFGDPKENLLFQVLRYTNLQLLLQLQSPVNGVVTQPCQGGSSERFYVWVWEAMKSLLPMVKLGFAAPVKEVIRFMFLLQDGGCPPQGKFTTLNGAIGTTGPRWANATGSALLLAAEYAICTQDQAFLDEYLAKMLRAARWILGEVKATRIFRPDGTKEPGFGVMPECCATDGDYGRVYTFTDAYSLAGVKRLTDLLQTADPAAYRELAPECRAYEQALRDAMTAVRREDGFIDRKFGNADGVCLEFNATCTAAETLSAGVRSPLEPDMRKFMEWSERHLFSGLFCSPVCDGINYMGNIESAMIPAWIRQGEWKKAWTCARVFREFAMTRDLLVAQERYSPYDDAFTPWQPNASCNGRYLWVQLQRLMLEEDGVITLLGGISPDDFETAAGCFRLKNLHTDHGLMTLEIRNGETELAFERELLAGTRLRVPSHFRFTPGTGALHPCGDGWETVRPLRKISGVILPD